MPTPLTARAILERLVAFPTVSAVSNLPLIDWVEDYLAGFGMVSARVPTPDGQKAALYASSGPEVAGGVILSGHSDVVPVKDQPWTTDPFVLTERDGRLYGRGSTDMKGFVALSIAALVEARLRGVARPVQLALSYDEEVGCTGCAPMIAEMAARLPRASAVIVGEPSMMKVVTGHKGGTGYFVDLKGHEVHSSLIDRGVSAIMAAATLIEWMNARNAENRARPPGPLAAIFDPPWTSLHAGLISGGTARNITSGHCRVDLEIRVVPGDDMEEWTARFEAEAARIAATMRAVHPGAGIALDRYFKVPGLRPESDGAAEALARRLTGDNARHVVSYGTEAGFFQAGGYSAVVCGPGDIDRAHKADEWIGIDELADGWRFMEGVLKGLA